MEKFGVYEYFWKGSVDLWSDHDPQKDHFNKRQKTIIF